MNCISKLQSHRFLFRRCLLQPSHTRTIFDESYLSVDNLQSKQKEFLEQQHEEQLSKISKILKMPESNRSFEDILSAIKRRMHEETEIDNISHAQTVLEGSLNTEKSD